MGMLRKLIPVEIKQVGQESNRVLEFAGSTEDVDRMGDVIMSKGWLLKPFKKNPVVQWAHNYDLPPIGRAIKAWVDKETKRLMFEVEFADAETYAFADTIYKLYKGGFLHATSVGFIPLDWEGKDDEENAYPKWEGNVFTKQELLELSAVPVPANANALVTARESGLITVKEFEAVATLQEGGIVTDPALALIDKNAPSGKALTERVKDCPQCHRTFPETEYEGHDICKYCGKATVTKPEETDDYIRIPVKAEKGKHKDHPIRYIDVDKKKGIKALYCIDDKVIITYLFDKDNDENWTLATAQAWVDEHAKNYTLVDVTPEGDEEKQFAIQAAMEGLGPQPEPQPAANEVSQEQLGDDIDYVHKAIMKVGLNETTEAQALDLASEIIMRSMGNDIPTDILDKVGAVLNAKNKGRLTQIQELAQAVLDSAAVTDEGDKQAELPEHTPTEAELTRQRALDVAEVTNIVIAQLKGKRLNK